MTIDGYYFTLTQEKPPILTLEEYEGLCCLRDRARRYSGAGDVLYLCLSSCSLLVQCAPDEEQTWQVRGYAFRKEHEPWLWVWLPTLVKILPWIASSGKSISLDEALVRQLAELEQKTPSALRESAQTWECEVGRRMRPYSVGFTRISPELYGDNGIRWYVMPEDGASDATIPTLSHEQIAACQPAYQAHDRIYVAPPRLFGSWRVKRGEQKAKLGAVDEATEWETFAQRVRASLKEL